MASKNVILTDKNGEQLAPATITDVVLYDEETTLTSKLDEINARIESLTPTGTQVSSIEIVNTLPQSLTEKALYLIPDGEQVVPTFPIVSELENYVVCINKYDTGANTNRPSYTDIKNASKFWLFLNASTPRCRRDSITIITWGTGATTSTPPTKIYEYDTSGAFEWVDITDDVDTATDFTNNVILHDIRDTIYSSDDIYRYTVGNREYNIVENSINTDGKITDIYHINNFNVYFVENGIATSQGSHNLKWVADNYY